MTEHPTDATRAILVGFLDAFKADPFSTGESKADRLLELIAMNAARTTPINSEGLDALVKHMANRFLSWRLPENFNPDCGIRFKAEFNEHSPYGPMKHQPIGTNLFSADQAEAMVRHMLEGFKASLPTPVIEEGLERVAALLKRHRKDRYADQSLADDDLIDTENAREIIAAILSGADNVR